MKSQGFSLLVKLFRNKILESIEHDFIGIFFLPIAKDLLNKQIFFSFRYLFISLKTSGLLISFNKFNFISIRILNKSQDSSTIFHCFRFGCYFTTIIF